MIFLFLALSFFLFIYTFVLAIRIIQIGGGCKRDYLAYRVLLNLFSLEKTYVAQLLRRMLSTHNLEFGKFGGLLATSWSDEA